MTYSEREFGASQSDYEPKEQQMSDIMERLRLQGQAGLCPVCLEAADYIERLRADRKQMSDTDIVSRMRIEADQWHPSEKSPIRELREGADEIERLRAGRAAVVEADVERNMVARPYSADEERVVKYIVDLTDIGGGPDPIGFLIASHNALVERLRADRAAVVEECRQAAETAARKWPHAANDVVAAIAALKGGAA
jgi:hypothetical protein